MTAGRPDRKRGAALFIVLFFSAVLAGLAAVTMRVALSGARAAKLFVDQMRADELGRTASDLIAFHALSGPPERRRDGAFSTRFGDAEIRVRYVSESARVDVNLAPVELIAAVLSAAGADPSSVAAVVDRITALRTQAPPTGNGPPISFQRTIEAMRAWDLPPDLAHKVLPSLTTASRSAQVDPVLAGRLVLAGLMGGDGARVEDYLRRRSQGFVNAESAAALLPESVRPWTTFVDSHALRAIVRVAIGKTFERRYELVLQTPDGPAGLTKVASWQPLY